MNDLLVIVGIICLLAGAYWASPALALMVFGVILILLGLTRIKGDKNGPD